MEMKTTYLGMTLKNPLVAAASPLTEEIDNFKRMEDAGLSAVVMHSLFEEQISHESRELNHYLSETADSSAEATSYFPQPFEYKIGPDQYLENIRKAKKSVNIPIIASLNGHSIGGWMEYAKQMESAGADGIELNIYFLPTDPFVSAEEVEKHYIDIVAGVKKQVKIPVAVKLSPFFSSMANSIKRMDDAGADAFVLFNRFYQPDIDLEKLEVVPNLYLSTSYDIRLPMRWIAILFGRINANLAATTGVQTAEDAIKLLMVGSDVTMLCATILKNGIPHAGNILKGIESWMNEHEYESIKQLKGSMSHIFCENPEAFERANYMKILQKRKYLNL